ncbi:unnamed protein product (macronuclear) [Paramecium tetraurelia]|uniref:Protein kinase domain-containing protein n=1 Tax=Paramecium tetraurelia TaxID=5888 RepID=A0BLB9_PARTE|nr:uncharacterized protein GSPATT00029968001 [Paramecium tetraurelia]CAK59336.1 unnamed protein product [Paramecium tetraurelia]|eukprot:XP_001426734.1 hypothetical protein (macronuclear) [Paramecium tetraurelia strain d4-2]
MNKQQSIGQYTFDQGKTLGEGTFGKVKLATHQITQEKVAIKILEKSKIVDASDIERVTREIQILKQIRHPNLVQLYEIIETQKQLFLVMEYVNGGELFDYIVQNQRLRDAEAAKLFGQLIQGIEYMHKLRIVHRDLKPENLMLENKQRVKIIDFGLSNLYANDELLKTACGSPCYAAPEMIAGKKYNGLNSDIWSAGVILFAMLAGHLPFEEANTNLLYKKILAGEYKCPNTISLPAKNLIAGILQTDPLKRYTITDIRRHPWMTNNYKAPLQMGIIVGLHKIPLDFDILKQLVKMGYAQDYIEKCVEGNRHNQVTTIYYLLLKKHLLNGGKSFADIGSDIFTPIPLPPKHASTSDYGTKQNNKPLPVIRPKPHDESPINLRGRYNNNSLHSQQTTTLNQSPKIHSVDSKKPQLDNFKLDLNQTLRDPNYGKIITPSVRPRGISDYQCRFGTNGHESTRQKSVDYGQTNQINIPYYNDTRMKTFYKVK